MKIREREFGVLSDGEKVRLFTVKNSEMSFSVTNLGCTVTSIVVPSQSGRKDDILLGFSTLDGFASSRGEYFGAFVGRFANRIGKAAFALNGKEYRLDKNDGENCLHGGFRGYDKCVWKSDTVETKEGRGLRFTRTSRDGEQGFPGNLFLEVTYILTAHNEIVMRYRAETDRDTPVSLTNHSYFNLKGNGNGTILDHEMTLNCGSYLEVDDTLVPTGKLDPVDDTPFDFRTAKAIGRDIGATENGYDHCFVVNRTNGKLTVCATVFEPETGRGMIVATNQPGVQFYTGNFLAGVKGKMGVPYVKNGAFCLETQQFPDAPNKPEFPDPILRPGDTFEAVSVYGFTW